MTYYGPKDIADSFRTVRKNTIQVAEDIPADKDSFRAAPGANRFWCRCTGSRRSVSGDRFW